MTNMEKALIEAGIKPPSTLERVWRAVKESGQGGITYSALTKRLASLPPGTISSRLNGLQSRGMVAAQQVHSKWAGRPVYIYTTDMDNYQVLPELVKKSTATKRAAPVPTPAEPAPTAQPAPTTPINSIDHLTVAQARALYEDLRQMFGRKNT